MEISRKAKFGSAVLFVLTILCLAVVAYGAEGHGAAHGGGISHEKWMDLLWRTLNFAGLVVILVLALKKPLANGLAGRRQGIIEQFEELEARKAEAEQNYKEYEAKLSQIDAEVQRIIDAAVSQGEMEKERIIGEADRAAADLKRQAEQAIQHEISEAKKNLRNEIAEQAALAAEELVKNNLKPDDQVALVKGCLDKVGG